MTAQKSVPQMAKRKGTANPMTRAVRSSAARLADSSEELGELVDGFAELLTGRQRFALLGGLAELRALTSRLTRWLQTVAPRD